MTDNFDKSGVSAIKVASFSIVYWAWLKYKRWSPTENNDYLRYTYRW